MTDIPPVLTDLLDAEEQKYLRHFMASVAQFPNALTWGIPPRIKARMLEALRTDEFKRQMDQEREKLEAMARRSA
jgi:hypothetical protein